MEPQAAYSRRRDAFAAEEERLARVAFRMSILRGTLFVGFLVPLGIGLVRSGNVAWPWWVLGGACFVAFIAAIPLHDRMIQQQRRNEELRRINEEGLARLDRLWAALPEPRLPSPDLAGLPLSRDLALFGRASLFHLLGTAHSPPGKEALARWLLEPAGPDEIAARQGAVEELSSRVDLRQELELALRDMEKKAPPIERFFAWAEGEPWLGARPWLLWALRVLPVLTVLAGLAVAATPLSYKVFLAFLLGNFVVSNLLSRHTHGTFDRLETAEGAFHAYSRAVEMIGTGRYKAPALQEIVGTLSVHGISASRWMAILHNRLQLADARRNAYLHFFLQLLLLWDFHVLHLLEKWQRQAGRYVRGWIAALGRFEALAAVAALRFENPAWTYPTVADGETRLAAKALGHPLIADAHRVSNDVEVGPARTFLLVTGSNMSGKSTLLRAIGLNAVLAQAGGPVCASSLSMPPVTIATSVLVEDSLTEGISFFMAELKRVQSIVATADRCHAEGRTLLYLLDEILRGTNSRERQIAVRRVLAHLLGVNALGAISTHDLEIAHLPELADALVPVHFRETLHPGEDPPMTFDYLLRPGVATTTNALKLLELVGLGEPDGQDQRAV